MQSQNIRPVVCKASREKARKKRKEKKIGRAKFHDPDDFMRCATKKAGKNRMARHPLLWGLCAIHILRRMDDRVSDCCFVQSTH